MVSFLCKGFGKKTIQGQCPKNNSRAMPQIIVICRYFFKKVYRKCLGSGKKSNNEVANLTEIDSCYER